MRKPQYNQAVENEVLRQHQRVIIDLARFASEALDLQTFMDDAVLRVAAAIEIDHVKLLRYRAVEGDLLMEAGVGWEPGTVKATAFSTDLASPPGRAFQTGQPVQIEDVEAAGEFRISPLLRAHNIVSLSNVPIFMDGAAWGVLEVDSAVLRGFSEDTETFLVAVAALVGLVIRRVEGEQGQAEALAAIAEESRKREIMLREMQHRMKNNFQMILAMIQLRKAGFETEQGRMLISGIADAITAMSLAHDQLSASQDEEVIAVTSYLKALCSRIERSLENITIEVIGDELRISLEQAVPIGLIVNELAINSAKHAFGPAGGVIRVMVETSPVRGSVSLTVSDNGKGTSKSDKPGSGLRLIRALTEQIRGRLKQESSASGTITRLTFAPRQ
jgi:two-component sensor histidine kinase/putative methionine-R-sulfoxide reductase with GAF domain